MGMQKQLLKVVGTGGGGGGEVHRSVTDAGVEELCALFPDANEMFLPVSWLKDDDDDEDGDGSGGGSSGKGQGQVTGQGRATDSQHQRLLSLIQARCPALTVLHLGSLLSVEQWDAVREGYDISGDARSVSLPAELGPSKSAAVVPVVLESKHDYESNTNEWIELTLLGASAAGGMVVTFDEQTKTEDDYDYVQFWPTRDRSGVALSKKLSGTRGWPGTGGTEALEIGGTDTCWIEWKTDGSNEKWGWRLTAGRQIIINN
jgi:hypothetical protein